MKALHLICVGKLKEKNLIEVEREYLKRIKDPAITIHETKAYQENLELEAQDVVAKIEHIAKDKQPILIALTERGRLKSTAAFGQWLDGHLQNGRPIIFIIGGASGHGQQVLEKVSEELSLSPLTFPHKLARILLIEQLYRAQTLRIGHPYHK